MSVANIRHVRTFMLFERAFVGLEKLLQFGSDPEHTLHHVVILQQHLSSAVAERRCVECLFQRSVGRLVPSCTWCFVTCLLFRKWKMKAELVETNQERIMTASCACPRLNGVLRCVALCCFGFTLIILSNKALM